MLGIKGAWTCRKVITAPFLSNRPIQYRATIRVTPVVDGDRAFVEWWATFDCDPAQRDERVTFFRGAFAGWLESLRRTLVKAGV